ncbi:polyribonucleotide nucleotidyltransferase [Candidatus Uhrbacteria bacterium]|nr:polyribonucleotide nucleotidyltransferase [Candidatus Uhrbacteria bacterium]
MTKQFSVEWGGKTLSIEIGRYAQQANGSCVVRYGDTVVLATATMSENRMDQLDFFPLLVDFEEKLYAAGRIKGSRFIKKEGRPTDEAVLTSRFIDRALRPLFDQRIRNEVQVIITCLAFDSENDPDILGLLAASCALHMSDIPWNGPIAPIRVSQNDGRWVINPSYEARNRSALDLSFAGTTKDVIMVEAGANQVSEETIIDAFAFGQKHLKEVVDLIEQVRKEAGKGKRDLLTPVTDKQKIVATRRAEVAAMAEPFIREQVKTVFFSTPRATKTERAKQKSATKKATEAFLLEKGVLPEEISHGTSLVGEILEEEVSRAIIEDGKRVDGRGLDDIRPLLSEVQVLPRVHGSAHFMRGETQVLSVATLGSPGDEQTLDGMELVGKKRYFHHYNFPPFSVGEVKPLRGPSRRDIGHGALAEKALMPVMPEKEAFPYAIRVVSEVLGSNGSSSMGSTCGSTLALMDAGVPIAAPVAGIAMGLATNDKGQWKVLTDLQDLEDGAGGMDFKIAGTATGITAIQMDTKTSGLTPDIIVETINRAKSARMRILKSMTDVLAAPRPDLSPYAPRIIVLRIDPERIGDVIGPGGKMINEIIDTTGVQAIDIEDDGLVMITSMNAEGAQKAKAWVENLTREVKAGETFKGKVTRLMDFGAFVEILPKKEGLVHVSELAPWRVEKVSDIVKVGDLVFVKIKEIDDLGRVNLTMKGAEGNIYPEKPPASASAAPRSFDRRPPRRP